MSWKSIACIAALGAIAAPAMALPTISVVKNSATTGQINITTTAVGSIGAEIALQLAGATLTGATINSAIFDTANPGDSPFIAGSPVGGDANGLVLGLANNRLFAAYGSGSQPAGTYKLLDFTYTGTGTGTATGLVASVAVTTSGLTSGAVPLGSTVVAGDFSGDGKVDATDLNLLLGNWGKTVPPTPSGWNGSAPTNPAIDADELNSLLGTWGTGTSSAVSIPEPATALLAMIGLVCLGGRRSA